MTNFELYKDIFAEIAVKSGVLGLHNGLPVLCSQINCNKCDFYKDSGSRPCALQLKEWMRQEHVAPEIPVEIQNLKVDDKILVSHDGVQWFGSHFKYYNPDNKLVYAFTGGRTLWTTKEAKGWRYVKLPDREV